MPTSGSKILEDMDRNCIFLDTSFFIRLLNEQDPLHENALGYYRYFLEKNYILKTSTISIAEYCVKGSLDELPLQDVQILPFNIKHAEKAGFLASIVFNNRDTVDLSDRKIIPNDTKLFAQADLETNTVQFATSDESCMKVFRLLQEKCGLQFSILNIRKPFHEAFGLLDLR